MVRRVAAVIYLDTHVVVWLYASGVDAISERAKALIEGTNDLRISPMVRLELQSLFEIDRVGEPPATVVDSLSAALGLTLCSASFAAVVHEAERYDWTRDPFDRLIVAQAALHEASLVTKDQALHARYADAVW